VNGTEIQGGLSDTGEEQIQCTVSHSLAVYMNGGQRGTYHPGFRCVVKAAQVQVSGNGNLHFFQCLKEVYSYEIIGADKYLGEIFHILKPAG
jgi:hypothetical protein